MSKRECLMLETPDKRRFFTHIKHRPLLIEFANTFGVSVSPAVTDNAKNILELPLLAKAVSDCYHKSVSSTPKSNKRSRKTILENARLIQQHIREKLIAGKPVNLEKVKSHFEKSGIRLSNSCFSNHLTKVRNELEAEGYKIKRVSTGVYEVCEYPKEDAESYSLLFSSS